MKLLIYIVTTFIIIISISLNLCYGDEPNDKTIIGDWEEAEVKWSSFANEHMERMKKHDATLPYAKRPDHKFDMEWVEIKSQLITKYLPDYKIYTDRHFEFVLDKKGHITCLGKTWPLGRSFESVPDFEVKKYSDFIRGLGIQIKDDKTAIEMVKLMDIITRGGVINDKELERREQTWKYEASKKEGLWYVIIRYIGPPGVSIMGPPVWNIIVDEDNYIKAVKEIYLYSCDVNGDGYCDSMDVKMLEKLIGECDDGSKYNTIADRDHNGCITDSDRDYLLKEISEDN